VNAEQFKELLAAVAKLCDGCEAIVRVVALYERTETDPRRHATGMRILNSMRDAALSLRHTLADAPTIKPCAHQHSL
jgi:hypothetical protein